VKNKIKTKVRSSTPDDHLKYFIEEIVCFFLDKTASEVFGKFTIEKLTEKSSQDYTLREFLVTKEGCSEERKIYHFHFQVRHKAKSLLTLKVCQPKQFCQHQKVSQHKKVSQLKKFVGSKSCRHKKFKQKMVFREVPHHFKHENIS
jgi:hypothetical protein